MKRSMSDSNFTESTAQLKPGSQHWIEACWNDMRDRDRAGEAYDAQHYISMIPNASDEQIADLAYGEFVISRESGKTVTVEQYLSRYSQVSDLLARQFAVDETLSQINDEESHPEHEHDSEETFLYAAETHTGTTSTVASTDKPSGETRIGRYIIVDRLKQGSQAEVYRAYDPVLKRDVLVKIELNQEPNQKRMFSDVEAIITANLNHPNIAPALDAGNHQGRRYSISRFIRGRTFDQWVRDSNPSPQLVAQTIAKVAGGLAHAHKNAVLHMDVKPRNIVIDENQEPYLIDFGLSVACDAYTDHALEDGSVRGTLQYMAPEQLKGDVGRIGPCSDIFGLGATLFMGLVGRAPYDAPRNQNDLGSIERCEWHAEWLDEAGLSEDMKSIVRRALATSPGERYSNCDTFAAELKRVSQFDNHKKAEEVDSLNSLQWATPWRRAWLGAAALVFVFGFVSWLRIEPTEKGQSALSVADPALEIMVATDDDRNIAIANRVPLVSADKIRLSGFIPAQRAALIVAFSPNGNGRVIAHFEKQEEGRAFQYPNDPGKAITLVGAGGTEVVALVTADSGDVLNQAIIRLEENPTPWELIPDSTALIWRNGDVMRLESKTAEDDAIKAKLSGSSRSLGGVVDINPAIGKLSDQFRQLAKSLNREGIAIQGIAFRHLSNESKD
jgi:serine/threonine protein kinase